MTGDELPQQDHVVRHVKRSEIDDDHSLKASAFCFDGHPDGVSTNWLEHFAQPDAKQGIAAIHRVVSARRKIKSNTSYALLQVQAIIDGTADVEPATAFEDPLDDSDGKPPDPSHSVIKPRRGVQYADLAKLSELLSQCPNELFPVPA